MSHENQTVDLIAKSLARVLPGAIVTFLGMMLVLAIGLLLLTDGAAALRSLTAGLPQPLRSISYLASLAVPLVILCWSARKTMGYVLSHITKTKGGA